jgi:hypothetical protein
MTPLSHEAVFALRLLVGHKWSRINAAGLSELHDGGYDLLSCQSALEELLEQGFLEVVTMAPPSPDQPWTLTGPWYGILFSRIRAWREIDDATEPPSLRQTGPRARLSALAF